MLPPQTKTKNIVRYPLFLKKHKSFKQLHSKVQTVKSTNNKFCSPNNKNLWFH